jgi:hypothetical protein
MLPGLAKPALTVGLFSHETKTMVEFELPLRITLIDPPAKVRFALQRGRNELFEPTVSNGKNLSFSFRIRVKGDPEAGPPRLLGEFAQGPPATRFVYVNSGKRAGDKDTSWDRRAKIPLTGLSWSIIMCAHSKPSSWLEVKISGSGRDGGPVCAGVKLNPDAWQLVE